MSSCSAQLTMPRGFARFVAMDPARVRVEQPEADRERQAVDRARQQASAEAEARFQAQLAALRAEQTRRLEKLEAAFSEFTASFERRVVDQLLDLSIRLAEVLVRRELPDRGMIREVIRDTLAPITDLQGVRVRLHPSDAGEILSLRGKAPAAGAEDRVEIVSDGALGPGDVMIESRNGYFDARIGERIRLVDERLRERLKDSHENHE